MKYFFAHVTSDIRNSSGFGGLRVGGIIPGQIFILDSYPSVP